MDFNKFKKMVQNQFTNMMAKQDKTQAFRSIVDPDELWETYLNAFPPGTDLKYIERTEHDCSACKNFIRNAGTLVTIKDGNLTSIWDIEDTGEPTYNVVAKALSEFVKMHPIQNIFLHYEKSIGVNKNQQITETGPIIWDHFFLHLPNHLTTEKVKIGTILADKQSTKDVMLKGLIDISLDSVDIVLDLISQGSLYRGEEHKKSVEDFRKLKIEFDALKTDFDKDVFVWSKVNGPHNVTRIKNTVIGTLMVDLSEGKEIERAVSAFEVKVAPTNYKRTTALVSKRMIDDAKAKIHELGYDISLERRFAVPEDVPASKVLFVDRSNKKLSDGIFDEIKTKETQKKFNVIEEIQIDTFIWDVLPKISSMEVLFENRHSVNLVSLIAPIDATAPNIFKWPNPFSWSYKGEVADSIKERVKNAGGRVDGYLRCSLSWFNTDDLDFHMSEPDRNEIYFSNKISYATGGHLDVDMNVSSFSARKDPVENICYPEKRRIRNGIYELRVQNFNKRNASVNDSGFDVEIEFEGNVLNFKYDKPVKHKEYIHVATITKTEEGLTVKGHIPGGSTSTELWGLNTESFHKVTLTTLSPNFWDSEIGNKHYFFMLDGCKNNEPTRGFYNEFLSNELNAHRKVLELVSSKLTLIGGDNQLSGVGFSSTQRNSLVCRVKGSFSRTLKVNF